MILRIPGGDRHDARVAAAALRQPAAGLQADVAVAIGKHPDERRMRAARTASIAAAAFGLAITSSQVPIDRPPPDWPPIQATDRYLPGPSSVGRALSVPCSFSYTSRMRRLGALAAIDHFLPMLEVEPLVAAAILPAGRAARPAIFDEEVARVGVHVRDAPGQPRACGRRP